MSTVPAGVVAEALRYLVEGGPDNLAELARFLSDTVLLTGEGFEPPRADAGVRRARRARPSSRRAARPSACVFYRAHELSGNTAFVDTLCDAVEARGANALPVFCGSLRGRRTPGLYELLGRGATRSSPPCWRPAARSPRRRRAGGDEEAWDVGALADLDVPVLQGLCLTSSRERVGRQSDAALSPMDAAMQVAIPEFDGRLDHRAVLVQGARRRRASRCTSPTPSGPPGSPGSPSRHARLRHVPNAGQAARAGAVRRTRPSTPGSATRSGWTPRPRRSAARRAAATPGTTSADRLPDRRRRR